MEGGSVHSVICWISAYFLFTGITSEHSLLPGPVIYVTNNSNVTFKCSSTNTWGILNFFDSAMEVNLAIIIFQANSTHCRPVLIDTRFGADKYAALPCNVGQPISIIVRYMNASYHNKLIKCRFGNEPSSQTTVKIREDLISPTINPIGTATIKENVYTDFTCTADSIPQSSIVWYMDGSALVGTITTSNPSERRLISTITYQAKKEHDNKNVYCGASNMYTSLNSTFTKLNILYVPTVLMKPEYDSYILYVGQTNISLTCLVVNAKPLDGISYYWINPGGKADGPTVIITQVLRTDEGEYRCIAKNVAGNSSVSTKQILVQYIPLITLISDTRIKEGNPLVVQPTIDAKPAPSSIWWTKSNNNSFRHEGNTLTFNDIRREATGQYSCHALNVLTPSGMVTMERTSESSINIDVLYIPEVHTEPFYNPYILYYKQQNVVLRCVVDEANPTSDLTYNWSSPNGSTGKQNFTIPAVEKWNTGEYWCKATNLAGHSNARKTEIIVQYRPVITKINDMTVVEGQKLVVTPNVDANPDPLSMWWTRETDSNFRHNGERLTINNIQRDATGQYTFHAKNVLKPSGLQPMDETSEMSIYVDVLYAPEIHTVPNFNTYVLYHKQQNVVLTCLVDHANPYGGIIYKWITPIGSSNNQNVTISTVEKSHSGEYACTASNAVGSSNASKIQITVQYGPLISNIAMQIDIVEGNTLNVSPIVDANPLPQFVWWIKQNNTASRYDMYNLTIHNIRRLATGYYTYYVMNTIEPSGLNALNMTANWKLFINVQYHPSTEITEAPSIDVLENNTVTLHCKVTDANPIMSSIVWYKYGIQTLETKTNYTFNKILRSDAGEYICEAKNTIGNGTTSVNINVLYPPTIRQLRTIPRKTLDEHQSVTFQCEVDSYPAPDITWIFYRTDMQLKQDINVFKSNFTIIKTNCLHTGSYICRGSNLIVEIESALRGIDLYVLCSARIDQRYPEAQEHIGIMENDVLNITVFLLAYPEPVISWTMTNFESGVTTVVTSNVSFNTFEHISTVYISNISKKDYGVYTLIAYNFIGLQYKQSIYVMPQGPPDPPTDILVACEITSMIVSWRPGFNGGTEQTFRVVLLNVLTQNTEYSSVIKDSSQTQNKQFIVKSLNADTMYIIYVEALNKFGIARSTDNDNCTTGPLVYSQSKSSLGIGLGVGMGTSVFILLLAGFVVFVLKRMRKTHINGDNNKLYQETQIGTRRQTFNSDQHNYDELQTMKIDSNPECLQTNRNNTYEEIGRIKHGLDYQNVSKCNTEPRKKSDESTLYANMKI